MEELKQSTVAVVKIGPFCGTTGTVLTALTIAQGDIRLSKAGGNMAQKSTATACVHDEIGIYFCDLSAADTNTLGALRLDVDKSGSAALAMWEYYEIVSAQYWNAKYSDGRFEADVQEIDGASAAAANFQNMYDGTGYAGGTIKFITTGGTVSTIAAGAIRSNSFVANAITAGVIADSAIDAATFAAGAINAAAIAGSALVAASFATGALAAGAASAATIAANALGASAATINAATWTTGALSAGIIGGSALVAASFGTAFLTADKIAGSALVAASFASGTITSAKFAAGAIDAAAIAGSALVAASFASGTITSAKIAGSALTSAKFAASCFTIANYDSTYRIYFSTGIQKNTAFPNLEYLMVDSTDHRTGKTGLGGATGITLTRSIDGSAWAAGSAALAEIGNGIYVADLAATDTNGDTIMLRFTADDADDTFIELKTSS